MKNSLIIYFIFTVNITFAQNKFSNCSTAFLNNKSIIESYYPNAKAQVSKMDKGILTVCTANISEKETKPIDKILFSIAIKDSATGTILLACEKPEYKFDLAKLLAKCNKGDKIVLITKKDEYSLPHNEILVK